MSSDPTDSKNDKPDKFDDDGGIPESKSQRKRDARQITALASDLVNMNPNKLAALPIAQATREAITHCAEIRAHGARKRQLHFVSKLLRESDNIDDIRRLVDKPELAKTTPSKNPHVDFRDRLIDDLEHNVDTLRSTYPSIDLQTVRQLIRNAQKECAKANEDPDNEININSTKSAKSLLRLLKEHQ